MERNSVKKIRIYGFIYRTYKICFTLIAQDCWSHIRRDSGASTQHSTEKDRSRKGSYGSGNSASVLRHLSPNSDSSNSQTDYSPTCNTRWDFLVSRFNCKFDFFSIENRAMPLRCVPFGRSPFLSVPIEAAAVGIILDPTNQWNISLSIV